MALPILEIHAVRQSVPGWSVEQYHKAFEAGILPENVELLKGVIVKKMTKSPRHSNTIRKLQNFFHSHLQDNCILNIEQPLTFADSEPEPDISIVVGKIDDFQNSHPSTALLIVEVSLSSIDVDREKGSIYAKGGVSEYWIANLAEDVLEVYTNPENTGYRTRTLYRKGDSFSIQSMQSATINLSEIF